MRLMKMLWLIGLLVTGLVLAACGAEAPDADHAHEAETAAHTHSTPSGDVALFDLQFIDGMTVHHEGAVEMAQAVLAEGEHAELKEFAQRIIDAQTSEIARMAEWRTEWYGSLPPTAGLDMEMGAMELPDDPGTPFDQRFLETMISHHEGAVGMAEMAAEMSQREEMKLFAEKIVADQRAEIEQMHEWLAAWYGK
jgi:uncharacterized protein (DUF305 family)